MIQILKCPLPSATIVIVLFVLDVVCSARAAATCGDYLHSRRSLEVSPQTSPRLSDSNVVSTNDEAGESREPVAPRPQPCSGPGCGKAPHSVPLPIPVTVPGSHWDQNLAIVPRTACERPVITLQAMPFQNARARRGFPLRVDVPPEVLG
jgi:hypothetical protein